jgi:hypothetical protein
MLDIYLTVALGGPPGSIDAIVSRMSSRVRPADDRMILIRCRL